MGVPTPYPVGTPFARKGPYWAAGYHTGIDFLCPQGSTLRASIAGEVVHAGWGGWGQAYGVHVIIEVKSGSYKGQRYLNAHMRSTAVKVGQKVVFGQIIGISGATGNVTGPHDHFEVRVAPYGYKNHINPQKILDYKPKAVFKYPAKPKAGKAWGKINTQNCAFNNAHGIKTDHRIKNLASTLVQGNPDIVAMQELPAEYRNQMDKLVKKHLVRMGGNYGRYTYGNPKTVKKIKTKSVVPRVRANGRAKPYTLLNCRMNGVELLHVNMHLQNGAAYATLRRKYLREELPKIIAYAKSCGLPKHRVIISGDMNGHEEIIEEMAKFGFYASFAMAHIQYNEDKKTTNSKTSRNGWVAADVRGKPIDMTFTQYNRPTLVYNNHLHGYADHTNVRTVVTFAAK